MLLRCLGAQEAKKKDLARSAWQDVRSSHYQIYALIHVIDGHGQLVCHDSIGTAERKITAALLPAHANFPVHKILKDRGFTAMKT